MEKINKSHLRSILTAAFLIAVLYNLDGQAEMPDALINNNMKDQFKFLQEKTRIYDNYRAIREDMFQKLIANMSDTLSATSSKINYLNVTVSQLKHRLDSLTTALETTKTSLENAISSKNSFRLLGRDINKVTYNSAMWVTILILAAILVLGFLTFKRNVMVTHNTEKELKDLKDEFQAYRKSSREAREKMSMDHFNEIKRIKGG